MEALISRRGLLDLLFDPGPVAGIEKGGVVAPHVQLFGELPGEEFPIALLFVGRVVLDVVEVEAVDDDFPEVVLGRLTGHLRRVEEGIPDIGQGSIPFACFDNQAFGSREADPDFEGGHSFLVEAPLEQLVEGVHVNRVLEEGDEVFLPRGVVVGDHLVAFDREAEKLLVSAEDGRDLPIKGPDDPSDVKRLLIQPLTPFSFKAASLRSMELTVAILVVEDKMASTLFLEAA